MVMDTREDKSRQKGKKSEEASCTSLKNSVPILICEIRGELLHKNLRELFSENKINHIEC